MEFREFIRKPFVVCEEEQPEVQQPEPEKPNKIITPDKRLILPAQPKREKPQGFTPREPRGPMKVDQFPDKIKDIYQAAPKEILNSENIKSYLRDDMNSINNDFFTYHDRDPFDAEVDEDEGYDYQKNAERINDETTDMNVEQILNHNNYAFRRFVWGSYGLNDFLRYGKTDRTEFTNHDLSDEEFGMLQRLMAFRLQSEQEYISNDDVYRGLNFDPFENLKEGQIISDPAFMSTASDSMGTASDFAGDFGTLMHIHNANNVQAIDMDYWGDNDQDEIVYPPNTALQFTHRDDDNFPHFNMLEPSFDDIDKYGNVPSYGKMDKEDRRDLGFMESKQPLKNNKMKDKLREAFQQRMNDFQFQVLTPENQEEKPESTELDDLVKQIMTPGE